MPQQQKAAWRGIAIGIAVGLTIAGTAAGTWLWIRSRSSGPKRRRYMPTLESEVERFTPKFPRTDLTAGLIDVPLQLKTGLFQPNYDIGDAPDGRSALWRMDGHRWQALNADLSTRIEVVVPEATTPVVWLATASGKTLRIDDGTPGGKPGLTAFRDDGSTAWTWESPFPDDDFGWSEILYDDDGAAGLALSFGGDAGLVAVNLQGQQLWHVPKQYVSYEMSTHRALPGYLLHIGGDAVLFGSAASGASPKVLLGSTGDERGRYNAGTYITHGRIFPDRSGRPALLLTGQSGKTPPVLIRSDAAGVEIWRAELPSEAEAIEMVEPPGMPRVFLVATSGGELLAVGDDGTLYWTERLPDTSDGDRTAVYHLSAGELSPGAWGVCVRLLKQQLLFRVHPERLRHR